MTKPTDVEKAKIGEITRRDFLIRMGYASAVALAAGGLGLALYDAEGPAPMEGRKALTDLGDYRLRDLASKPGKMAIVRGSDRREMFERGMKALGGMEVGALFGTRPLCVRVRRGRPPMGARCAGSTPGRQRVWPA